MCLSTKSVSTECMVANGGADGCNQDGRKRVHAMKTLGHALQADGGFRADCADARAAMWRTFWGTA
eukprot:1680026-Alexandrium_andersonii.AAC.1